MNLIYALLLVLCSSLAAYALGARAAVARIAPAMLAAGWRAPPLTRADNPFRAKREGRS